MSDALNALADLGQRFHGADLSFRRHGTGWPALCRARLHATKNERAEYRCEGFGETADEAVAALSLKVASLDAEGFVRLDMATRREK